MNESKKKTLIFRGSTLLLVMVFGSIAFILTVSGLLGYALYENKASNNLYHRDVVFHIAEAGINYYRWHLAHNPTDFTDGTTGQAGPYVHIFKDKFDKNIGSFSLAIAPLLNSSIVSVMSTGTLSTGASPRTLKVRLGFESFTDYAFLQNADMTFGFTSEVHGAVHSNGGIRFDGTTDSWIESAKDKYTYENQTHNGVWGAGGPKSFWKFPVPSIDFSSVTADLAVVKTKAQEGGTYLLSSGEEGWQIVFRDTVYDLYKVNTRDCYYGDGRWRRRFGQWYWEGTSYCFDIGSRSFVDTYPLPQNGVIFVEDNTWVEGRVDGRITIGVGTFPVPADFKEVFISSNLTFKEKTSDDAIGIIAQGDVVAPFEAPSVLEINAVILSQYGKVYTPYYNEQEYEAALKDSLTFFGSLISYEGGGWKYVNGWGNVISGYENTNHTYDGNLKYYAPPGFPAGSTYELISWEEVK